MSFAAAVAVLGLLVSPLAVFASPDGPARAPKDPDSRLILPIDYIGGKPGRVQDGTTAVLITEGSGLLYELCAYGTAAVLSKGVMAFATSNVATIGSFAVPSRAISPVVLASAHAVLASLAGNGGSVVGCWKPAIPIRFESGLVLKADDASVAGLAIYRLDTGVNP